MVSFLIKASSYPIIQIYLEALEKMEVSINSIDVFSRYLKSVKVPPQFVTKYTLKIITEFRNIPEFDKDRSKMAKIVGIYIKALVKSKVLDLSLIMPQIEEFATSFIDVDEVESLYKLLKKEWLIFFLIQFIKYCWKNSKIYIIERLSVSTNQAYLKILFVRPDQSFWKIENTK